MVDAAEKVLRGLEAFQEGQVDNALADFSAVLDQNDDHPQALHGQALVRHQKGDIEGATESIRLAIRVEPNVAGYHNNLGFFLQQQGEASAANAAFFDALKLDPHLEDVYENLGWMLDSPASTGLKRPLPAYLRDVVQLYAEGEKTQAMEALARVASLTPAPTVELLGHVVARGVPNWECCVSLLDALYDDEFSEEVILGQVLKAFQYQGQQAAAWAVGRKLAMGWPECAAYQFNAALLAQSVDSPRKTVIKFLRRALQTEPTLFDARLMLGQMHKKSVAAWHVPMMNDRPRNEAFNRALQAVVRPGDLVLDIGAGSGLLSMMAARAGAERVVACEMVEDLANMAREIVADNGLAHCIQVEHGPSQGLQVGEPHALSRKADVLVAEIFDAGLLGEKAVATFEHARENLLREGGTIVPASAKVYAALIESEDIYQQLRVQNENACGFDLSSFNKLSSAHYSQLDINQFEWRLLSEPVVVETYEFHGSIQSTDRELVIPVAESGCVHGVLFFFDLKLAEGVSFSTDPRIETSHWQQAVQILASSAQDLQVPQIVAGQTARLQVIANQLNFRGIRFEWKALD